MADIAAAMKRITAGLLARDEAQQRIEQGIRELAGFVKALGFTLVPDGKRVTVSSTPKKAKTSKKTAPKAEKVKVKTSGKRCKRCKRSGAHAPTCPVLKTAQTARATHGEPVWEKLQTLLRKRGEPMLVAEAARTLDVHQATVFSAIDMHGDVFLRLGDRGETTVALK